MRLSRLFIGLYIILSVSSSRKGFAYSDSLYFPGPGDFRRVMLLILLIGFPLIRLQVIVEVAWSLSRILQERDERKMKNDFLDKTVPSL
jgi:hypothetical protein